MSEVKVDTISERTAANGVVVDGVTIKDSGLTIPSGGTLTVASGGTITNSGTATGFGSDNTPAFQAYLSGSQSLAYDTGTKVTFDTEDFDTDGAYDNSTNYRFTVPAGEGGKYFVYYKCLIEGPANSSHMKSYSYVQVNGSNYFWMAMDFSSNYGKQAAYTNSGIITLAAADYVECTAYIESTPTSASTIHSYARAALFGAYKLIGL